MLDEMIGDSPRLLGDDKFGLPSRVYRTVENRSANHTLRLPLRGVASEARHFTIEQVQRILSVVGEPWRTLFCICTLDGLRAGEALGLQWGDIDLEQRILHIRRTAWYGKMQTPNTRESETTLPIPQALAAILKNYRTEWKPNPDEFLFVTRNERPPRSEE